MTRSEEELRVGTTERERGRARLRKYVVTEQVERTVPVRREEVRVEREPITDANVDQAMDGPEISEEEHEVVLHEEEAVVEKRVVPKERVRLDKETVTTRRRSPSRSARSRSRPKATRAARSATNGEPRAACPSARELLALSAGSARASRPRARHDRGGLRQWRGWVRTSDLSGAAHLFGEIPVLRVCMSTAWEAQGSWW